MHSTTLCPIYLLQHDRCVLQVQSDLTARGSKELESMKMHHALELEALRARLSDKYVQGMTQFPLHQ